MAIPIFPNKKKHVFIIFRAIAIFLILSAVAGFGWLFLFSYDNIHAAFEQNAMSKKVSEHFIIAKVKKTSFEEIVKNFDAKQKPTSTINFNKVNNPF